MNPSRIFIERPVATSLLMVAIILVGVIAYKFLPLSALPQVDYPTIRVLTLYPGASPEVMTSSVTAPLERQFGQMPGLNQMTSTSSAGASSITLQFDLKLGLDVAEQQVQAAINAAGNLLPSDLPSPPVYAKVNPADAPVLTLAVTSKIEPLTKVHDMVDTRLAQKISQLPGVGLVSLEGGQKPGVRIRANPTALAAYGLNVDDLRTTISNANVNTPKGNFDGPARAYTINANDQITDPATFRDIVVAYRNGAPVRVSDVATVERGAGEQPAGRLGELDTGGDRERPAPARRQRHRRRRQHQGAAAAAARDPAALARRDDPDRPHAHHPRLGARRADRAHLRRRPGRRRDLPLPRRLAGHAHPQPVGAAVADRHPGGDVSRGLQPQQPVDHGAHHRHRLRGRRRHRHDREHRPLHRARRRSQGSGARGLGPDRLHRRVAHRVADRRADPAAVHERRRRPPVQRVRGHALRHHPDLGGGIAHPGADDVRAAPAPAAGPCTRRRAAGASRGRGAGRPLVRADDLVLRPLPDRGVPPSAADAADRGRHHRADRRALYRDPQGLLPGPGHRPDPGRHRGAAKRFLRGDERAPARARRRHPGRSRRREPDAPSSASTAPTRRSTRAAC